MPEPLKNVYNLPFMRQFAELVRSVYGPFDKEAFIAQVMDDTWETLELKARMRRITGALGAALPEAYAEALDVLFKIDETCRGLPYLFFPDFVEVFGQSPQHWTLSMQALERFTSKTSSEFAVRPFLLNDPKRMMRQMDQWAAHPDEHVRRLASEGCRPRLPWGQSLPMFKRDPSPILPVLERLKEDESLYVRKSVANNLNDIAKDHSALVLETARRWKGNHPHTDWIIRHGCRTLVRQAVPEALAIFGYANADAEVPLTTSAGLVLTPDNLAVGDRSEIAFSLRIREGTPVHIRIEYGIGFVKANGRTAVKKFLLSDKTVPGGASLKGMRSHNWSDLSTRRHYPGEHKIALLVNGRETATAYLTLRAAHTVDTGPGATGSGGSNGRSTEGMRG